MKRIKAFISIMLAAMFCVQMLAVSVAAEDKMLISINGKTVMSDDSVSDVSSLFGQPKLVTPSAFGGNAYSFYGENYEDYLYIETSDTGKIVSYCSFVPNYVSDHKSYGAENSGSITYADGYFATDFHTREIWGGCYYNCGYSEFSDFESRWKSDPQTYLAAFQKQGALMFNALSRIRTGKNTYVEFNEELFLTNEQLKENGSDLYTYSDKTGKSKYVDFLGSGMSMWGYDYMPNPLYFAKYADNYIIPTNTTYANFEVIFGSNQDAGRYCVTFVDPAIIEERTTVPLTDNEKTQLAAARKLYSASTEKFNAVTDGYFSTGYQYENLPLEAGEMKKDVLEATRDYLNAIRVGAGLSELTLSDELSATAQAKAVLTMYMAANGISNPNPHNPPQPEGVPDDFYNMAMSILGGENLYHNSILGGDFVIGSVENALQEAYGDTTACGHRYNLLDPYWTEVGFGSCNGQGVHEFSGYKASDEDMVAWPSKGIMLTGANREDFRWTAQFYSGHYKTTNETYVEIENLNNSTKWIVTSDDDLEFVGESEISYYDSSISYADGDVFKITIKNVTKDGVKTDYVYRTVFASTFDDGAQSIQSVNISRQEMNIVPGSVRKLTASVDDKEAGNQLIRWSSSDESVATVSPNGVVTAVGNGTAVITAASDANGLISASCTVNVSSSYSVKYGDVNMDDSVTAADALLALQNAVGKTELTEEQIDVGDVNGSGSITATDALLILQHTVGKISVFPVEQ